MFWNTDDEGKTVARTEPPRALFLAKELAAFLHHGDGDAPAVVDT